MGVRVRVWAWAYRGWRGDCGLRWAYSGKWWWGGLECEIFVGNGAAMRMALYIGSGVEELLLEVFV